MILRRIILLLVSNVATSAGAQGPFVLDTNFRLDFQSWYVNSMMQLADGDLILSGRLRVDGEWSDRGLVKVDPTTGAYNPVPGGGLVGGGKLTRWGEKYYVGAGQTLRRLNSDGFRDTTFDEPNLDPSFASLQGGDYHVFPDGRVLLTGLHQLFDPDGSSGFFSLIWLSDSGWVDTTRTHRQSNAPIYQIEEEADGQFLCFYSGTEYEGQATNGRILRINADGTLDPTLESRVGGSVYSFVPLPDGRFYAAGTFNKAGVPGTIRLARFLPNGDLDPTFDNSIDFDLGTIPDYGSGAVIGPIQPWHNGAILVLGTYQFVNGFERGSTCVVDSAGQLTDSFDQFRIGQFTYEGFTYATLAGALETEDDMLYLWGGYHGCTDGTINDASQRFVSRLYGPDWPAAVEEEGPVTRQFSMYPNPADAWVTFNYSFPTGKKIAFISVLDALGREVAVLAMPNDVGQIMLDTRELGVGMYTVCYINEGAVMQTDKLIVQ